MLFRYKPDEGRNARQIAFWLVEALIAYGCFTLRGELDRFSSLRRPISEGMSTVPLFGATFNLSLILALAVFVAGSFFWIRFLSREKIADHLIEVETEMKKVTWPSFKEASNSSIVVIATVLLLMAFLALSDAILGGLFKVILFNT
ncbi:MAG: preprotein translocase subunit SecE [Planctomycetota bacterium]|nr:MAG: preprotein translocase subunit SecE [Planctomycetota bacterium]